jgi:hypothetical protein
VVKDQRMASKRSKKKPKPSKRAKPSPAARIDSLSAVFQALGARDPSYWARSQVTRGTDALARFVLLRALWLKMVEPGRLLARARADVHVGPAIDRLVARTNLADVDALVRITQELALKDALSVLDDPADNDEGIGWGVFRRDKTGAASARLAGLTGDLDASRP